MSDDQPGVRRRMQLEARRISSQHQQLDTFHDMLAGALDRGAGDEARSVFQRFQDALDAHFSLEENLYFPALGGLKPELDAELAELVREHAALRIDLVDLERQLGTGALEAAAEQLDGIAAALTTHEQREEALVARITRHPAERPGG